MIKIRNLLGALKKLRLLNLSSNKLSSERTKSDDSSADEIEIDGEDEELDEEREKNEQNEDAQMEEKPHSPKLISFDDWPDYSNLNTLILNACYLDLAGVVESLLAKLPSLAELHLASNNYKRVTFSADFLMPNLKVSQLSKVKPQNCIL